MRVRDCVLLRSGPRKTDLPYVAKIASLWEDPETCKYRYPTLHHEMFKVYLVCAGFFKISFIPMPIADQNRALLELIYHHIYWCIGHGFLPFRY